MSFLNASTSKSPVDTPNAPITSLIMHKAPPVKQKVCLAPAHLLWLRRQAVLHYSSVSGVIRKLIDNEMRK